MGEVTELSCLPHPAAVSQVPWKSSLWQQGMCGGGAGGQGLQQASEKSQKMHPPPQNE